MCRLFGFRSSVPSRAHRSLVEAENALASQSARHPDGWGIGWYVEGEPYVIKSATPAHSCEQFARVSTRVTSNTFLAHVRRATVGSVGPLNVHPFRFGRWLFAHNGTVFDFERLRPWMERRIEETGLQAGAGTLRDHVLGDTDSETLFFYVIGALGRHGVRWDESHKDAVAVGAIVRSALWDLDAEARRQGLARPITNVMLTDGEVFVAHRAGMPLHFSTQKSACADAAACPVYDKTCLAGQRRADGRVTHLLVATERIGEDNVWEEIADGATVTLAPDYRLKVTAPPKGWTAPEVPNPVTVAA